MSKSKVNHQQELHQQLLACMKGEWHSMVVVPATSTKSAVTVASALAEVSSLVRGKRARLFSAEGQDTAEVSRIIMDMMQHISTGGLAIVSIDSVTAVQGGIPVTLAADVALLVVEMGVTSIDDAKRTVGLIGPQKFLGAVTIQA